MVRYAIVFVDTRFFVSWGVMESVVNTILTLSIPAVITAIAALWQRSIKHRDQIVVLERENAKNGVKVETLEAELKERDQTLLESKQRCEEDIAQLRQDMQVISMNNQLDRQYIVELQRALEKAGVAIPPHPKASFKRRSTDHE